MGGRPITDAVVGLIFGRLKIVGIHGRDWRNHTILTCECECGRITFAELSALKSGQKKSCGCLRVDASRNNIKHGAKAAGADPALTRTFNIWADVKKRCTNPNAREYKWYGGRGITLCADWVDFANFYRDMGVAPEKLTLERIDVNRGYSKDNCTWIPLNKQAENKTTSIRVTYEGVERCLKSLCTYLGIPYGRTYKRYVVRGWDLERAIQP